MLDPPLATTYSLSMLRLVSCLSAISIVVAQSGTNYQTGDGQVRSESVDPQGNVRGQYSYIDPNGKTITVKYSAGKDGFQVEGDHIPRAPGAQPTADLSSLGPHQFPQAPAAPQFSQPPSAPQFSQPPSAPQFSQPPSAPQFSQLPSSPRFSQFPQPGVTSQFGQFPQSQFSQQSLFAPSAGDFGPAASRGQVAQFGQGEAAAQPAPLQYSSGRGAPQFQPQQQLSSLPPQFGQLPNAPRLSSPQQQTFSPQFPAGTQFPGAPQFTSPGSSFPGQFSQEQLNPQQLSQFRQQGPVTFPQASHRLGGAPVPVASEPSTGQVSVSQDPNGAYKYQFALGQ